MYHLDLLEVFSNLAQSHGRIGEYFGLFYLFIKHFGKNHLKGHRDACLLEVFLEHVGLLLLFSGLVHSLYMNQGGTSSIYYYYEAGSGAFWGESFGDYLSGFFGYYFLGSFLSGLPLLPSSFLVPFGSSFFGYYVTLAYFPFLGLVLLDLSQVLTFLELLDQPLVIIFLGLLGQLLALPFLAMAFLYHPFSAKEISSATTFWAQVTFQATIFLFPI